MKYELEDNLQEASGDEDGRVIDVHLPEPSKDRDLTPVRSNKTDIDPPPPPPPSVTVIVPVTPPNQNRSNLPLSPPSPPGRRWVRNLRRSHSHQGSIPVSTQTVNARIGDRNNYRLEENSTSGSRQVVKQIPVRPPHPLCVVSAKSSYAEMTRKPGRYVPHLVMVSLETEPIPEHIQVQRQARTQSTSVAKGYRPRLGQLMEAFPFETAKASAVTCVKFSPSTDFCLVGYGVREPLSPNSSPSDFHPVTALYQIRGGMRHISTLLSGDDDVNIARFHPDSGYGFVYGTKQGRVRVLSPRPWNYYYYNDD
jgi:hypothetical protein